VRFIQPDLSARVSETLSQDGGSWRDFVLLTDTVPPSIMRVSADGAALLHIDDSVLAKACTDFLMEQRAQTFRSFAELKQTFGFPSEVRVR